MGLKDAVDLNNSGLSDERYSYAMRAHLDFVVTERPSSRILFAVEYDGAGALHRHRHHPARPQEVRCLPGAWIRSATGDEVPTGSRLLGRNQLQSLVERWFSKHEGVQAMP